MPTPVGTAPIAITTKPTCSTCHRLQFSTVCARKQCSKCCRTVLDRCGYIGHDSYKAHLALAVADPSSTPLLSIDPSNVANSFALTRPPPICPPAPPINPPAPFLNATNIPTASALPVEAAAVQRSFRRRMDDMLKEEWDASRATWDAKLRGDAQKRENKWRIDHSFFIWYWRKDGENPTRICVQGIQTIPNFALTQDSDLMARLGVARNGEIDMYQSRYGMWQTQAVNEAFTVTPKQILLFRYVGVKNCPLFDVLRAEAAGKVVYNSPQAEPQPVQVTIVAPKPLRTPKRKRTSTEDINLPHSRFPYGTPRLHSAHTSPFTRSPFDSVGLGLSGLSPLQPMASTAPSGMCTSISAPMLVSYGTRACSSSPTPRPTLLASSSAPILPRLLLPTGAGGADGVTSVPHGAGGADGVTTGAQGTDGVTSGADRVAVGADGLAVSADRVAVGVDGVMVGMDGVAVGMDGVTVSAGSVVTMAHPHGLPWPNGIYARDMAEGFLLLAEVRKKDLPERFGQVFSGAKWVHATYFFQRAAWYRSKKRPMKIIRMQPAPQAHPDHADSFSMPLPAFQGAPALPPSVRKSSALQSQLSVKDLEQAQFTIALEASLEDAAREEVLRREAENTERDQLTAVFAASLDPCQPGPEFRNSAGTPPGLPFVL
ncbi:hypothetical protein C8Q78DRAFT_1079888 [Trametes maxima]|nr:hypothetical protein C8Q78DRAFT_1079888 [Trametes maxima]